MRTCSSSSSARRSAARRSKPRCSRTCSVSCRPTVSIGWSDVIGSWKTIARSRPASSRRRAAESAEQVAAVEADAPLDGGAVGQHAEQGEHRHRLPAAALAGDAEHLALLDAVVDPVDDGDQPARRRAAAPAARRPRAGSFARGLPGKPVRGSNTSRRLSPRKLKASTTVKIASPGNVPIHHHWKYCVPSATIDPHSACGGWAPRPRNERPERSRIAVARSSVIRTSTGPATFGSTSRTSARRALAPSRRADCTYSVSPTLMHEPADDARVRRPRDDHDRDRGVLRGCGRARPRRPSRG